MMFRLSKAFVLIFLLPVCTAQGATLLSVDEAAELALATDRRISEAESAFEVAESATLAAWGSYLPLFGVTGGYSRNWTGPGSMSFSDDDLGLEKRLTRPASSPNR